MLNSSSSRLASFALALGIGVTGVLAPLAAPVAQARSSDPVQLKLRRLNGRVDVVITGLGASARVISQRHGGSTWTAQLDSSLLVDDRLSPNELRMPSQGLVSIRLQPSDAGLALIVQSRPDISLPVPTISANGADLIISFIGLPSQATRQTGQLDLRRPGRVAQPTAVPEMRARASAPPVGDMAVGTMLINNRSFVAVSGPPVSLTLNNSPAKDALMSLARLGGYGFVFVGENGIDATGTPVTMSFRNERFDRALNSVLMASGLQGKLDGQTLLVGSTVAAKTFGPQMSKVFRLNQVDAEGAAQYLASLGASMTAVKTIEITSGEAEQAGSTTISNQLSQTRESITETQTYGSSTGPLVGLNGVTNSRLNTVTLVGEPMLISVAESYLKQLDLRKRQVAVKVQILSVTLNNDKSIDSSFSARMGDTYIVSQSGKAHLNFGQFKPGNPSGTGVYKDGDYGVPGTYTAKTPKVAAQDVLDPVVAAQQVVPAMVPQQTVIPPAEPGGSPSLIPVYDSTGQPIMVPSADPAASPTLVPVIDSTGQTVFVPSTDPSAQPTLKPVIDQYGRPVYVSGQDPSASRHSDNSFYSYVEALVQSSSAKTLAQPTLLVQEGEAAVVETGQSVITGVSATETANGSTQFQNTRENAGLTVDLSVSKIDDNGFISLELKPEISVPIPAGTQEGVGIFNIQARKLESGSIRLRDGQSLILTGVITDSDRQQVRKWPILGDMPLIGQLFRQSSSSREKNELVIIVTPTILDDEQGGRFGYGYQPGTPAGRQLVQSEV